METFDDVMFSMWFVIKKKGHHTFKTDNSECFICSFYSNNMHVLSLSIY